MYGIFPKLCYLQEDYYANTDIHELVVHKSKLAQVLERKKQIITEVEQTVKTIKPELYTYWTSPDAEISYEEFVKAITNKQEAYALPSIANKKSVHKIISRVKLLYLNVNKPHIDFCLIGDAIFNLDDFKRSHTPKSGFKLQEVIKYLESTPYFIPFYLSTYGYKTTLPIAISMVDKDNKWGFSKPIPHASPHTGDYPVFSLCLGGYQGVVQALIEKHTANDALKNLTICWKIFLNMLEYAGRFNPSDPYGSHYYALVPKEFRIFGRKCERCGKSLPEGTGTICGDISYCSSCFYVGRCRVCKNAVYMNDILSENAIDGRDGGHGITLHYTCKSRINLAWSSYCRICNTRLISPTVIHTFKGSGNLICTDCAESILPLSEENYKLY